MESFYRSLAAGGKPALLQVLFYLDTVRAIIQPGQQGFPPHLQACTILKYSELIMVNSLSMARLALTL